MKKLAALIAAALLVVACQRPAGGSQAPAANSPTPAPTSADLYDY